MIQIRRGVFETNSSSSHSVSVHKKGLEPNEMPIDPMDKLIHVSLGKFNWEWEAFPNQIDKLSYLVTLLMHKKNGMCIVFCHNDEERRGMIDELMKADEFEELSKTIGSYVGCDGVYIDTSEGYIDHQSHEDYKCLKDFLDDYGVGSVVEFVFDSGIVLKTGNDNEGAPKGWYD